MKRLFLFLIACASASCDGSCKNDSPPLVTNAMGLQVADAFGNTAPNVLYTSVKICDASSNCQTVDKIQVDTGSSGLRVFKQALTIALPPVMSGQSTVGECQSFALGNTWGPVQTASLTMAAEPPITTSIQVIDSMFGKQPPPFPCDIGLLGTPTEIHANGILGISVRDSQGLYFGCQGSTCTSLTLSPAQMVANPLLLLPTDNNGVIVNLPSVADDGQPTAYGDLVLGIGTQWNNDPSTFNPNPFVTVSLNPTNPLSAATTADNRSFPMFALDTGSNAFFFTDPGIPHCPSLFGPVLPSPWFCPANPKNFAVRVTGASGSPWNFQVWIRDEKMLVATGNLAFNDLGGSIDAVTDDLFIAGLPFFYGKTVYIGYANKTSPLGSGPLYAYSLR